ncbi:hypothetical protein ENH_00071950 [Eimeria necatrix]|uniref:Uncharacterized protein n=1 Tax=Eimeria necatrix TaxID=51315 RepID=U6N4K5_9EIME|nr:hypothetical protein ENH_00071950 [Eimeria necatrix]CDJ69635.1 hypothetical protein ENH_00071950 [Eimeria necatrix]
MLPHEATAALINLQGPWTFHADVRRRHRNELSLSVGAGRPREQGFSASPMCRETLPKPGEPVSSMCYEFKGNGVCPKTAPYAAETSSGPERHACDVEVWITKAEAVPHHRSPLSSITKPQEVPPGRLSGQDNSGYALELWEMNVTGTGAMEGSYCAL